jgi:hypothetical protein
MKENSPGTALVHDTWNIFIVKQYFVLNSTNFNRPIKGLEFDKET